MATAIASLASAGRTATKVAEAFDLLSTADYALGGKGLDTVKKSLLSSFNRMAKRKRSSTFRKRSKRRRVIRRKYRRSRMARSGLRTRSTIGHRVGSSNCKAVYLQIGATVSLKTKNFARFLLTDIDEGEAINQRERKLVNLRGFKIRLTGTNLLNVPMWVNIAVVKDEFADAQDNNSTFANEDFFRGYGAEREATASNALNGQQWAFLPMNPGRFTILKRKRIWLGPRSNSSPTLNPVVTTFTYDPYVQKNWFTKTMYVPVKRQLRYKSQNGAFCDDPLYMLVWCSYLGETNIAAQPATGNALEFEPDIVTYFKDPKN